jgi:hypothetical protein
VDALSIGVDLGAPGGDQTAVAEVRRGELGEIERVRIVTGPELRSFAALREAIDANDAKAARVKRTTQEMARAFALQQPQGLGFLFPGLRPRSQR